MKFGEKLRISRKKQGLTQAALAMEAGLGVRTIIAYEKGETYPQKRTTYLLLARLLEVPADYLLSEELSEDPSPEAPANQAAAILPNPESSLSVPTVCMADERDIPAILNIRANSRTRQPDLPPISLTQIRNDLTERQLYTVQYAGRICAVFTLTFTEIPTGEIVWQEGSWQTEQPCGTLLRFFSDGTAVGLMNTVLRFCKDSSPALRAVTERGDLSFRLGVEQRGFTRCGTFTDAAGQMYDAYELRPV